MTPPVEPPGRPVDVDTGFWLWVGSLPLLTVGQIVDVVATANKDLPTAVLAISVVFVVILAAVVLTFQILICLLYTSPSPRDGLLSRMPSSA